MAASSITSKFTSLLARVLVYFVRTLRVMIYTSVSCGNFAAVKGFTTMSNFPFHVTFSIPVPSHLHRVYFYFHGISMENGNPGAQPDVDFS